MVAVPSNMLDLGTSAPDFNLKDIASEKNISLKDYCQSKGYLIMFICNHCPYVKNIFEKLAEVCNRYVEKNFSVFAISSNDIDHYPEDHPEKMLQLAKKYQFKFPYLYDEDQSVAKAYQAACTPDFFLFDKNKKLYYRGQFDDSRPGNKIAVTGQDLVNAFEGIINGTPPEAISQKPSIGCNIKWRFGNEPSYFKPK